MKPRGSFARTQASVALALLSATFGYVVPAIAEDQHAVDPATVSQAAIMTWVPTGSLIADRSYHTATLLPNGKVLVVGGIAWDARPLDTAELYDPATGTWSATGRLNSAKTGHSATLLPNGQVLVVGQAQGNGITAIMASAELYDPSTGTWRFTSPGIGYLQDHTATLLQSGKVLFTGGWGLVYSANVVAALYDPATGTWSSSAGKLITVRSVADRATLLQDGRVLVTGGTNDSDFFFGLPSAEFYDSVVDAWSRVPDLHVPRFGHSATVLPDGKVLVAGGDSPKWQDFWIDGKTSGPANNSAETFDPVTGNWSTTSSLNTGRGGHTASLLPNGEVLVAGGYTYIPPNFGGATKTAELYDPSSGVWHATSDLNVARLGHTATLLPNGKVLVVGGGTGAELYGPAPPGTIVPAFTGSWFDPGQSGHGLLVEVLPNNQFLAAWFAFDPAGTQQSWFLGVGTYGGTTATINSVVRPTGGRWIPNFDPSQVVNNPWGTLKFTFMDCSHGKVEFTSAAGYGAGSMNLTRLTQPAGLAC